jgi:hypothetical protein
VYVETSVISYLTARPTNLLIAAAHQQITQDWWQHRRHEFELYASELVIRESQVGDALAAEQRLTIIEGLALLTIDGAALQMAEAVSKHLHLPERASADALHIGLSIVHGMDYLVTWNCRHIANARHRQRIEDICDSLGYVTPVICTPEELTEE